VFAAVPEALQLPWVPPAGSAVQTTFVCPALTEQKSVVDDVVAEQVVVVLLSALHWFGEFAVPLPETEQKLPPPLCVSVEHVVLVWLAFACVPPPALTPVLHVWPFPADVEHVAFDAWLPGLPCTEQVRLSPALPLPFVLHVLALVFETALHVFGQEFPGDPACPAEQWELPVFWSTEQAPTFDDVFTEHWTDCWPWSVEQLLL
jgi:hypothetical protein